MVTVWVFNGNTNHFPSAVFSSKEKAERWIEEHSLEGTLTEYPVDQSVYDWAIRTKKFTPKKAVHSTAQFIANFSSGSQDHSHYGEPEHEWKSNTPNKAL